MFMPSSIKDYLKSIITNYTVSVFIISAIGLFLFYITTKPQNEFPKEVKIAKFGSIIYGGLAFGLLILKLLLKKLA